MSLDVKKMKLGHLSSAEIDFAPAEFIMLTRS